MNKVILKAGLIASVLIFNNACSQKSSEVNAVNENAKVEVAKTDSAAILEAKKKAAKEELAKLPKPYNDKENAEQKIKDLVAQAKKENKNIMIQAGGNWCIWCLRFNQYVQSTPELKEIVDQNYLYYHLNYSPENKNEKVFAQYDNPGAKYGYPVFIVLDQDGKMIHTQDSAVLEEGKGYSLEKTKAFFLKYIPTK